MAKRRRMGRGDRAVRPAPRRRPSRRGARRPAPADPGSPAAPAAALVCGELRRFPWPANPDQRYGLASPWLAVVNARGPWGVWQHYRKAPLWLPWCRSLWGKPWWRAAEDGLKVFCWSIWQGAAEEDVWGIVWGDPVRLCRGWGLDALTFTARLEAMLAAGLVVYLTDAERDAAMAWRPAGRGRSVEREEKKPEGEGGSLEKKEREETGTGTATGDRDSDRGQQVSGPPGARAKQVSDSREGHRTVTGTATGKVTETGQGAKPQAQHSTEPANLPKSDHGAVAGTRCAPGHARGLARPPSVSDPVTVGEAVAWSDPRALAFGRAMYEAIHGRAAPPDLQGAHEADKADVGVWVHYWVETVRPAIGAGRYDEFQARCVRDVGKKRKLKRIRNLGGLAMARIVPGIVAAMGGK